MITFPPQSQTVSRLLQCDRAWLGALAAILLGVGYLLGPGCDAARYQQGQSVKIMFVPVPAPIWGIMIYA